MNMGDFIGNTILSSIVGSFFGFLVTIYKNTWKNKRKYRYHQLDRLYGPIYALILQYQHHRKTIENIINNNWKGEIKDVSINPNTANDAEIMVKSCAEKCLNCSERIFELLTSNIMYARREDIISMESFVKKYCDFITVHGSSELPPVFSDNLVNPEITTEFIHTIKHSYEELLSQIVN